MILFILRSKLKKSSLKIRQFSINIKKLFNTNALKLAKKSKRLFRKRKRRVHSRILKKIFFPLAKKKKKKKILKSLKVKQKKFDSSLVFWFRRSFFLDGRAKIKWFFFHKKKKKRFPMKRPDYFKFRKWMRQETKSLTLPFSRYSWIYSDIKTNFFFSILNKRFLFRKKKLRKLKIKTKIKKNLVFSRINFLKLTPVFIDKFTRRNFFFLTKNIRKRYFRRIRKIKNGFNNNNSKKKNKKYKKNFFLKTHKKPLKLRLRAYILMHLFFKKTKKSRLRLYSKYRRLFRKLVLHYLKLSVRLKYIRRLRNTLRYRRVFGRKSFLYIKKYKLNFFQKKFIKQLFEFRFNTLKQQLFLKRKLLKWSKININSSNNVSLKYKYPCNSKMPFRRIQKFFLKTIYVNLRNRLYVKIFIIDKFKYYLNLHNNNLNKKISLADKFLLKTYYFLHKQNYYLTKKKLFKFSKRKRKLKSKRKVKVLVFRKNFRLRNLVFFKKKKFNYFKLRMLTLNFPKIFYKLWVLNKYSTIFHNRYKISKVDYFFKNLKWSRKVRKIVKYLLYNKSKKKNYAFHLRRYLLKKKKFFRFFMKYSRATKNIFFRIKKIFLKKFLKYFFFSKKSVLHKKRIRFIKSKHRLKYIFLRQAFHERYLSYFYKTNSIFLQKIYFKKKESNLFKPNFIYLNKFFFRVLSGFNQTRYFRHPYFLAFRKYLLKYKKYKKKFFFPHKKLKFSVKKKKLFNNFLSFYNKKTKRYANYFPYNASNNVINQFSKLNYKYTNRQRRRRNYVLIPKINRYRYYHTFKYLKEKKRFNTYYKKLLVFKTLFSHYYGERFNVFIKKIKNMRFSRLNYRVNILNSMNNFFYYFEYRLISVIKTLYRCKNTNIVLRLLSQGAIFVNGKQVSYPKFLIKTGDLIFLKPRYLLLNMKYFLNTPYGFLLKFLTYWKLSYSYLINFKIMSAIFFRSYNFRLFGFNKKFFNKKWLKFFFSFVF